jgi:hypothetical protein
VAKSEELERENQQNGAACVQMAEGSSGGHEEKKKSKMGFKTAGNTVKAANKWSPKAVKNTKPKTALLKVLFFHWIKFIILKNCILDLDFPK